MANYDELEVVRRCGEYSHRNRKECVVCGIRVCPRCGPDFIATKCTTHLDANKFVCKFCFVNSRQRIKHDSGVLGGLKKGEYECEKCWENKFDQIMKACPKAGDIVKCHHWVLEFYFHRYLGDWTTMKEIISKKIPPLESLRIKCVCENTTTCRFTRIEAGIIGRGDMFDRHRNYTNCPIVPTAGSTGTENFPVFECEEDKLYHKMKTGIW